MTIAEYADPETVAEGVCKIPIDPECIEPIIDALEQEHERLEQTIETEDMFEYSGKIGWRYRLNAGLLETMYVFDGGMLYLREDEHIHLHSALSATTDSAPDSVRRTVCREIEKTFDGDIYDGNVTNAEFVGTRDDRPEFDYDSSDDPLDVMPDLFPDPQIEYLDEGGVDA